MKLTKEESQELFDAAFQIVSDYENWGEVLQTDDGGEYSKESAIGRLQVVCDTINNRLTKENE